jgi:pimeloyl-ACP methyl ester carboxylesterase
MSTVIFIHGMFVTYRCWDGWAERFTARGHTCEAPHWPGRDATPAELRARHPDAAVGRLSLGDLLAHYEAVVRAQKEPPVLVGHSMGGLVVQLLLNKGLGARGVAIDSAPPKGVLSLRWSFLRANWPALNPFVSKYTPLLLSEAQFRYAFAHTLSPEQLHAVYEKHVVPESRVVGRAALTDAARIEWDKPHAPLLFVTGGADHIIPASLNRSNAGKYKHAGSRVEVKNFDGRTHYTILDGEGWTEVADAVADWIAA